MGILFIVWMYWQITATIGNKTLQQQQPQQHQCTYSTNTLHMDIALQWYCQYNQVEFRQGNQFRSRTGKNHWTMWWLPLWKNAPTTFLDWRIGERRQSWRSSSWWHRNIQRHNSKLMQILFSSFYILYILYSNIILLHFKLANQNPPSLPKKRSEKSNCIIVHRREKESCVQTTHDSFPLKIIVFQASALFV